MPPVGIVDGVISVAVIDVVRPNVSTVAEVRLHWLTSVTYHYGNVIAVPFPDKPKNRRVIGWITEVSRVIIEQTVACGGVGEVIPIISGTGNLQRYRVADPCNTSWTIWNKESRSVTFVNICDRIPDSNAVVKNKIIKRIALPNITSIAGIFHDVLFERRSND